MRPIPQTQLTDPTVPPPGPLILADDITFNPSETALLVSVRSNGAQPGLIYVYPIKDGQVSTESVVSSFPSIPFAFSLNFLDGSDEHLLVTNPHVNSPGAAFVSVSYPSLEITLTKTITIPGQVASCWAAYAPQFDTVFVLDAAQPNITVVSPETGDVRGVVQFDAVMGGGIDSRVDREWLYTLTDPNTDPKVMVWNVKEGGQLREVQSFDIEGSLGETIPAWFGLAIYPTY